MANDILELLGINSATSNEIPKPAMFENPFSLNRRIRRLEYGISLILYLFMYIQMIGFIIQDDPEDNRPLAFILIAIPVLWFLWAQGAKRCHDLGNSGWYQLIPFYVFWMLFQDGKSGQNEYGENPKEILNISNNDLAEDTGNSQKYFASIDPDKPSPAQKIKHPVCAKCGCTHASGSDFGSMVDRCSSCGEAICRNCKKLESYHQLCPLCGGENWSLIL